MCTIRTRQVAQFCTRIAKSYRPQGSQHESVDWVDGRGIDAYASLLRWCGNRKALLEGKRVHGQIVEGGLGRNLLLGSLLVQMYCKCGAMEDAITFFDTMSLRNVFLWNCMIKSYSQQKQAIRALQLLSQMQSGGVEPNKITFVHVLSACARRSTIALGKMVHSHLLNNGFKLDVFLGTALINMYSKCGNLDDARNVFDKLSQQDAISWTAIIAAYAQHGVGPEALQLFHLMQREGRSPDQVTFVCILDACASSAALAEGMQMHVHTLECPFESNLFVGNALVNMYGKCGTLDDAWVVFDRMPAHDVVSWNAIIASYTQHGHGQKALELFSQMHGFKIMPNKVTFISVLDACARSVGLVEGKHVHHYLVCCILESDVVLGTALVNMYGKCGNLESARKVFDELPQWDIVSWNAMVAVYAQHGHGKDALDLFDLMECEGVIPDNVTRLSVLTACSHAGLIDEGRSFFSSMIHKHGISPVLDHYVCVIDLLGRGGLLNEAENLVNNMPVLPGAATYMALLGACRYQADFQRGECAANHVFELDPANIAPYVMLSNIYAAAGMEDDVANVIRRMKEKGLDKQSNFCHIEVEGQLHQFKADYHLLAQKEEILSSLQSCPETKCWLQE